MDRHASNSRYEGASAPASPRISPAPMKRFPTPLRGRIAWLAVLLAAGMVGHAADSLPPGKLPFQGFLTDSATPPAPLGKDAPQNFPVVFRIYDALSGGRIRWAEQQVVTVDNGLFSVTFGEGSPVGTEPHTNNLAGIFQGADASDRFVGITVVGQGPEIAPRIQFFPSPFAHLARLANGIVNEHGTNVLIGFGSGVSVPGTLKASSFAGNGAGLSGLPIASLGGTIAAGQLADSAVTTAKIAPGAITPEKIAPGAITSAQLAAGAVTRDKIAAGSIAGAKIAAGAVTLEKLAPGAAELNLSASGGGVGSVVLSPTDNNPVLANLGYVRIGRAALTGDSWTIRATKDTPNTPTARRLLWTAGGRSGSAWTGSKWIVWGGTTPDAGGQNNTGAMFDPALNSWTPMTQVNAPAARREHSMVWTGTHAIILGGWNGNPMATGAKFDPIANTWTAIPNANRNVWRHFAVWTGSKMMYWGGGATTATLQGQLYDPAANTWSNISTVGAPSIRHDLQGCWTGTEAILFGGEMDNGAIMADGKIYNPATDTWRPMANGPQGGVARGDSVWTGKQMIVWGGAGPGNEFAHNDGGVYDPATDSWRYITAGTFANRRADHAVWTGTEMLIWGGYNGTRLDDGIRYDPATDTWTSMSRFPLTTHEGFFTWTGTQILVFGGESGDRTVYAYTPAARMFVYAKP